MVLGYLLFCVAGLQLGNATDFLCISVSTLIWRLTKSPCMTDIAAEVCVSNLRIADGCNLISWLGVFENFENGYAMDRSYVPDKVREFDDEVETMGSTPEDGAYVTPPDAPASHSNGGCTSKGDTANASQS